MARVEAGFDPLSGAFAASSGGLFDDSDEEKEVAPITSKPLAASSGGLFGDSDDEETDPPIPILIPTPPPPAPVVKLTTADLSHTKIIKEKQSTKKKKKPIQQHKTTNNALFGGADDEDNIFSSLRPKIEQGTLDSFLSSGGTTAPDNETEVSGGLFDDSDEDKEEEGEGEGRTGRSTKGTGAYLKRMLQEDNEEEDYSDLKVAGLISTDVDNAGGLLEEGQGIEQAKKDAMDTTDASLLAVREDDDLESLMAATQVNTIDVTKQENEEEEDIFKVSDNTNNDEDDDDLFSMMGMGGDDEAGGGGGVMICPASMPIFRKAVVAVAGCSTDVPDA